MRTAPQNVFIRRSVLTLPKERIIVYAARFGGLRSKTLSPLYPTKCPHVVAVLCGDPGLPANIPPPSCSDLLLVYVAKEKCACGKSECTNIVFMWTIFTLNSGFGATALVGRRSGREFLPGGDREVCRAEGDICGAGAGGGLVLRVCAVPYFCEHGRMRRCAHKRRT